MFFLAPFLLSVHRQYAHANHFQVFSKQHFLLQLIWIEWFFNDVLSIMVPIPFAHVKQGLKTHLLLFPQEYSYKHHEALEWIAMNMQPWLSYIIYLSVVLPMRLIYILTVFVSWETFGQFKNHRLHFSWGCNKSSSFISASADLQPQSKGVEFHQS